MPARKVYPALYLLTEPNWILSMRYRAEGGRDPAYFVGSGVMVWCAWVSAAAPGWWLGAAVGDPARFGLDLVMPVFFAAMLVQAVARAAQRRELGGRRRCRAGGGLYGRRLVVRARRLARRQRGGRLPR